MVRFLAIKRNAYKYGKKCFQNFGWWRLKLILMRSPCAAQLHIQSRGEGGCPESRQSLREIFHLSFHSCSHYTRDIQGNTSTAVSSCHTDRCHTIILVYTSTIYSSTIQFGLGGVVGAALNEMGIMSSSWLSLSLCSWRACRKSPTSELAIMELVDKRYMMIHITFSSSSYLSLSVQRRQQQHHRVAYIHTYFYLVTSRSRYSDGGFYLAAGHLLLSRNSHTLVSYWIS